MLEDLLECKILLSLILLEWESKTSPPLWITVPLQDAGSMERL